MDWERVVKLPAADRIPIYRAHLEREPGDAAIWFDLGLAYKSLHDWQPCADANRTALLTWNRAGNPAWWNLGIAATALRDWRAAREAWRGFGIDAIEPGDAPLESNFGIAPVRLPHGEVVWGTRLDPARVIVRNIPLPGNGYRWGDIVLHDGAPNGEREWDGARYPVFDVLERWSPSEIPTLAVDIDCRGDDDARALVGLFESNAFAAEDWTRDVRRLCEACSHGLPPDASAHQHERPADGARRIGLASPLGLARRLLEAWRAAAPDERGFDGPHLA
jgi:hypothetical protein